MNVHPLEFWQFIEDGINSQSWAGFVKVIDSRGSSPGRRGFMMAVGADGQIRGTIGGGIMEHRVIEELLASAASGTKENFIKLLDHKKNVPTASGLQCTGSQTVALFHLTATHSPVIRDILSAFRENRRGIMTLSQAGMSFAANEKAVRPELIKTESDDWRYTENCGKQDTVFVFGSGHVGLSVSKIFSALGFRVIAFDPRPDAPTVRANTFALKLINAEYDQAYHFVEEGPESYVVIVTSERDSDAVVLRSLAGKDFAYIGMMGSEAKAANIFKELRRMGIDSEWSNRVISPIGLPIISVTPDEIAVSIVAQVINRRNELLYPELTGIQ